MRLARLPLLGVQKAQTIDPSFGFTKGWDYTHFGKLGSYNSTTYIAANPGNSHLSLPIAEERLAGAENALRPVRHSFSDGGSLGKRGRFARHALGRRILLWLNEAELKRDCELSRAWAAILPAGDKSPLTNGGFSRDRKQRVRCTEDLDLLHRSIGAHEDFDFCITFESRDPQIQGIPWRALENGLRRRRRTRRGKARSRFGQGSG
jgi:hypothetical protein